MNGIYLNIAAYSIISLVMYLVSDRYTKELELTKNKMLLNLKLSGSLLLMIWSMFMVFYLIVDFENIIKGPLNIRLNFFETLTNFVLPYYIFVDTFAVEIINFFKKKVNRFFNY
jgi:hypothetical protein